MIHFKKIILITISLFVANFSHAQEQWDLEKCVDYAIENNLTIQQVKLDIDINEVALTQSKHEMLPNLNGFASHDYNWGRSFDVYTNEPVNARVRSNNFGLSSSWVLFRGMSVQNTIKQNKLNLEASRLNLEDQKNFLMLNVVNAYLRILMARETLKVAENRVSNSEEQITQTRKLVNAGVLPETNLFDLLSQLATEELQVVNAENDINFNTLQLKQLLQIEDAQPFQIFIPDSIPDPDENFVLQPVKEIYDYAEGVQPNVISADKNVESSEVGIDIAKSNFMPTLSLRAGINTFYSSAQATQVERDVTLGTAPIGYFELPPELSPTGDLIQWPVLSDAVPISSDFIESDFGFKDQLEESLRKSIGFSLSIPIYNRHMVRAAVNNAKIQNERARLQSKIVRNELRQTIEQSNLDVISAGKSFSANQRRVQALTETFRVTEQRYQLGSSNITDLNIAKNNLSMAEADLITSKYQYIFRMKILDFYLGKEIKL
ncbi:MAG: TolC family protein [Flammeovirgaceae bacterium]|nr:TolC family protein [Flammeovirgaceae bacterium]